MGEQTAQEDEPRKIVFLASLPNILSAIRKSGEVMRVQLEIPKSEVPNAVALFAFDEKTLMRVTIEVVSNENHAQNFTELNDETEKKAKREPTRLGRRRA